MAHIIENNSIKIQSVKSDILWLMETSVEKPAKGLLINNHRLSIPAYKNMIITCQNKSHRQWQKRPNCTITDLISFHRITSNQALAVFPAIKTGFVYSSALVLSCSLITPGTRWENAIFTSIQPKLICQLGQAEWSGGKKLSICLEQQQFYAISNHKARWSCSTGWGTQSRRWD